MSRSGHPYSRMLSEADIAPGEAFVVGRFEMPRGIWFVTHEHPLHQLAWSAQGTFGVRTEGGTFVLPPTLALWLPAGVRHATGSLDPIDLRGIYVRVAGCPIGWTAPTVVAVSPLLRELMEFLSGSAGAVPGESEVRNRAERLLCDLLEPVTATAVRVPELLDDRARRVADALTADPADGRSLPQWAAECSTSTRTLARIWLAETGMGFGRWRTQLRLQAALPLLAAGTPVATVARAVGYETSSAFVAAFRGTLGVTPGKYFGGFS